MHARMHKPQAVAAPVSGAGTRQSHRRIAELKRLLAEVKAFASAISAFPLTRWTAWSGP